MVAEARWQRKPAVACCSNIFCNDVRAEYLGAIGCSAESVVHSSVTPVPGSGSGAQVRHVTGRTDIVSTFRAFHGRTLGALSTTHNPVYREGFGPLLPGVIFTPYNNSAELEQVVSDKTAAVILEVVQGEGGVHVGTQEFLDTTSRLCRKHGALLIVDEVQTGFGRTGRLFGLEHFGVEPDMVCLAKSIAGGLPMGAVLCSDRIKSRLALMAQRSAIRSAVRLPPPR
jgi:acetylornithine/LysW-gamma-L-lysine aminotransferase